MFGKVRAGLTYANVTATVALCVALGGTLIAAKSALDGDEIDKRSIPGNRLEVGSVGTKEAKNLLAKDFKRGQLPAGPQGPQGPQGAQGTPGISGLQKVVGTSVNNSNSFKSATATCPAGKRAIGSGGQVGGITGTFPNELANVVINFIEPTDENTVPGSVTVFAFEEEPTVANWIVQATAMCANVS